MVGHDAVRNQIKAKALAVVFDVLYHNPATRGISKYAPTTVRLRRHEMRVTFFVETGKRHSSG
jgi:hypothetical protein